MLICATQQSNLDIYIYTLFFILFAIIIYHRILNIIPCAIHLGPCCLSILHIITASANPKPQYMPTPFPSPLANASLSSMSVSLFLFVDNFIHVIF